jgi:periplasmic protein CpxP/Spy
MWRRINKPTKSEMMKINQLGLIAALAFGLLSWSTALAQEGKEGKGKRAVPSAQERLDKMTTELKLTDEQKPKVKAAIESSDKKRQEIFADSSVPREQRREKMQAVMEEQNKKMKEILTAEQYGKWEKMRDSMRPGRGPNGEKKGGDAKKAE